MFQKGTGGCGHQDGGQAGIPATEEQQNPCWGWLNGTGGLANLVLKPKLACLHINIYKARMVI